MNAATNAAATVSSSSSSDRRAQHRAWVRAFVAERPATHVLVDRPGRIEILYRLPHLRAWRRAAGWAQWDLAYRSGVEVGTISRLERGRTVTRINTVERIASALGLANHELIERAPDADELVAPTQRVQAVEDEANPGDVRFYLPRLWHAVAHYAAGAERLAERVGGITPEELAELVENTAPAPWSLIERLARELHTPALKLIDW